ncbi:hypothetical protein [Bacillus dakarensis]|uniref:hypothetical protein n=1 Tax=Robertmurraya dakarensis TaxID=1926278 RepID=UPI000980FB82|nr:hypothetical protein [Bacillus dakarensis]
MSRGIKLSAAVIVILGVIGYGVYYFGTNIASEKLMDAVSTELEESGQIQEVKQYVENDPELKQFIEEAETADQEQLPFSTKEEATRVIIQKVGMSEIKDIATRAQEGTISKEEILQTLQAKLTEEEIMALKVIAYKELYQ